MVAQAMNYQHSTMPIRIPTALPRLSHLRLTVMAASISNTTDDTVRAGLSTRGTRNTPVAELRRLNATDTSHHLAKRLELLRDTPPKNRDAARSLPTWGLYSISSSVSEW